MTDRTNALLVVLEKDIRIDDAQVLVDAIKMLRGVLDVECNIPDPLIEPIIRMRVLAEVQAALAGLYKKE